MFWTSCAVAPCLQALDVPFPPLKFELDGSQAMSPATAITGSPVAPTWVALNRAPPPPHELSATATAGRRTRRFTLDLSPRRPSRIRVHKSVVQSVIVGVPCSGLPGQSLAD